jgi:UDP-N-acetylmuramyl pentapeptide phosphotransferase/UDP-N-acetylglucosamine-1-phosphate transferase
LVAFAALIIADAVPADPAGWVIIVAMAVLGGISWLDDRRGLSPLVRLVAQAGWVIVGLFALPPPGLIFQGLLPHWLDWTIAALVWLWFINLFNFMDGIDGLAGVETTSIGLGLCLIGLTVPPLFTFGMIGLVLVGGAIGFLVWNWQPARIFLGDVGSVPLGYLLGWLLLGLAASGAWAAALILPAYYLGDATLTLALRLRRGERMWQAHREHFYQQAVRGGLSHARVTTIIGLVNVLLIALALSTFLGPIALALALIAAALLVGVVLWYFSRILKNAPP